MRTRNLCNLAMITSLATAFCAAAPAQQGTTAQPSNPPQSTSGTPSATTGEQGHKSGRQDAASSSRNRSEGPQSKLTPRDQKFVMDAAQGGMMEVQLAQVAQKQGHSEQVKQLAQRIEQDHTNANNELKSFAEKRDITLPSALDQKHQAVIDRLSKLNGDAFDRAYAREMVSDHRKDIKEFEWASNNAFDSDLKAFAAKTLPTLREHLRMAEEAAGAKKSASTTTKSTSTKESSGATKETSDTKK